MSHICDTGLIWVNIDLVETDELNKKAEKVDKPEDATGIISIANHQESVFKRFKDKEKFITLVNAFKVHKSTITFKRNIFKLCGKYPKLMKSSIGLGFLKNYF